MKRGLFFKWWSALLVAVILVWCMHLGFHVARTGGGGATEPEGALGVGPGGDGDGAGGGAPAQPPFTEPSEEGPLCPPPVLSIRVALVGNEFKQQLPIMGYGGIETAVENLAWGVNAYMQRAKSGRGEWCAEGWVEVKEFIAVVPRRSQTTDLDGNDYPFRVLETDSAAGSPTSVYISEVWSIAIVKVRDILNRERPDVIWSQSGWSADGLFSLGIPIVCSIHDSGRKQFHFGNRDKHMLHYRFISESQRQRWLTSDAERAVSSSLWIGLADKEFDLGDPSERSYYLYVSGNWRRQKGIDEVLALARLNPSDEFRVYGNQDLQEELVEFASSHPNFKYFPNLPRGAEHINTFKRAKALLMFTHLDETFGMVTIEAFSKGTPVFGSTKGANRELILPELGFVSDNVETVNEHLHRSFDHKLIHETARQRHHVTVEVMGLLNLTRKMIVKEEWK